MSKRAKAKRRERYYRERKICQRCGPGDIYMLDDWRNYVCRHDFPDWDSEEDYGPTPTQLHENQIANP